MKRKFDSIDAICENQICTNTMDSILTYKSKNEYAFVTLLYGSLPFFVEALTLAKSLQKLKDNADIIILIGDDVSDEIIGAIHKTKYFTHMIRVETPHIHESHIGTQNRWTVHVFNKCHIWGLTQYKKVMFLDADIIVHKKHQLFDLFDEFSDTDIPAICIIGDCLLSHKKIVEINDTSSCESQIIAGLILVTPSEVTYTNMMTRLQEPSVFCGKYFTNHEEMFLQAFFKEWLSIHCKYQFIPLSIIADERVNCFYKTLNKNDVVTTHFCGWKNHSYLKHPEYLISDKNKYQKRLTKKSFKIVEYSINKWMKVAEKVNDKVYKKIGKHLADIGDWQTKVSYVMKTKIEYTCK